MARKTDPPGFRFHPTDEELVVWYLKRKVLGKSCLFEGIPEIELHKCDPQDLKAEAEKSFPESRNLEWYFFCRLYKKFSIGSRTNRAAKNGVWKSTGEVKLVSNNSGTVGRRRTLVFYNNSASQGNKTNWVIYEYSIEDDRQDKSGIAKDAYVLCKIFEKSGPGPKNGEQYGAPFKEEDWDEVLINGSSVLSPAANDMPLPPGPVNDQTIVISEKEPNPLLEHDPQTSGVSVVEEQSDSPPMKKRKQSPSPKILVANDIPLPHKLMINPNIIVAMKEPISLLEHDPQPSGVSTMEEQSHYNERSEAPHGSTDGSLADPDGDWVYNALWDLFDDILEWKDLCQPMETLWDFPEFLEWKDLSQPMETGASGSVMFAANIENGIDIHNQSIPVGDTVFPAPTTNNQYSIFEGSNSSAGLTVMGTEAYAVGGVSQSKILSSHSDL